MSTRSQATSENTSITLRISEVSKRFGTTLAVDDVSLRVHAGELVGIAGHNGAGKTTLLTIATGQLRADSGTVELAGVARPATGTVTRPGELGVRMVHQELSLCPTLRVDDTAAVHDRAVGGLSWRREAWRRLRRVLDEMFPEHGMAPGTLVRDLSISRQQMLECACALLPSTREPSLLVLDEPTSSLDSEATASFYAYLRARAEHGLAAVVTTHRLQEMVRHLDRIYVMRDGRVVTEQTSGEVSTESLVRAMGVGAHQRTRPRQAESAQAPSGSTDAPVRVEITEPTPHGESLRFGLHAGEIVGLAGLEGHGQLELLDAMARSASRRSATPRHTAHQRVVVTGTSANVSGDRAARGIFRFWDVRANMTISSLAGIRTAGLLSRTKEAHMIARWWDRLGIKGEPGDPIVSLSGGTQQKVLLARALALGSDVLLLEDPTRGVDQSTKDDIYALLREQARAGTCVVWFSTENEELRHCDRVLVLRGGHIVGSMAGAEASEDTVIAASFAGSH